MLDSLRCIIVDEEEGVHFMLGNHLQSISTITLCGSYYNAIDAMKYIYKNPVDVVFLDINMPGISGVEMLKSMSNPPLIVLTTTYSEYALASYKYKVVDYLIKPIEFVRFIAAIDNIISRDRTNKSSNAKLNNSVDCSLMLKVDGDIIRIMWDRILYVQSWGNYVKVHTDEVVYLSSVTTIEIESRLGKDIFMRIHKSYIVSLKRIRTITGSQVILYNGAILPIGNTYKRELFEVLQINKQKKQQKTI